MVGLLELIVSGLSLGSLYALIALGIVVVFRSSGLLNLAQGEFAILGAFLMTTVAAVGLVPWPLALVVVIVVLGAVGAVGERVVLRPLMARPAFVGSILTLFMGFVIHVGVVYAYGTSPRPMTTPWNPTGQLTVLEVRIPYTSVATIVVALTAMVALAWLLQRTRLGAAMRAVADDQEASVALGLPSERLLGLSWALAAGMAAVAGVFLAMPPRTVSLEMSLVLFMAFPAVILGGLDSPLGAALGGLALGVIQVTGEFYLNPLLGDFGSGFHRILPFIVMILVLMVRPNGLFGTSQLERV
ncbi:branched-chain amino acid ABC transporter permease [Aeromicrobium sp. CTD01-1L150]|uniref:branched-chain amino acid ABC transporter permease n=1 Tax=Aeromicrobium sp. CTD01-1L150 TaxID=3341830 RepID=UPI0035BEF021